MLYYFLFSLIYYCSAEDMSKIKWLMIFFLILPSCEMFWEAEGVTRLDVAFGDKYLCGVYHLVQEDTIYAECKDIQKGEWSKYTLISNFSGSKKITSNTYPNYLGKLWLQHLGEDKFVLFYYYFESPIRTEEELDFKRGLVFFDAKSGEVFNEIKELPIPPGALLYNGINFAATLPLQAIAIYNGERRHLLFFYNNHPYAITEIPHPDFDEREFYKMETMEKRYIILIGRKGDSYFLYYLDSKDFEKGIRKINKFEGISGTPFLCENRVLFYDSENSEITSFQFPSPPTLPQLEFRCQNSRLVLNSPSKFFEGQTTIESCFFCYEKDFEILFQDGREFWLLSGDTFKRDCNLIEDKLLYFLDYIETLHREVYSVSSKGDRKNYAIGVNIQLSDARFLAHSRYIGNAKIVHIEVEKGLIEEKIIYNK